MRLLANLYIQLVVCLIKFPIVFTICPYELVKLNKELKTTNNSKEDILPHFFLQDTFKCNQNLTNFIENNSDKKLTFCSDSALDVVFEPRSVFPNGSNMQVFRNI